MNKMLLILLVFVVLLYGCVGGQDTSIPTTTNMPDQNTTFATRIVSQQSVTRNQTTQSNINFVEVGGPYDNAYNLMDINGKLVYTAEKGGERFVVIDGVEKGHFDNVQIFNVSDKIGYVATLNNQEKVVFDGVEDAWYNHVYVYPIQFGDNKLVYSADTKNGRRCILGGKEMFLESQYERIASSCVLIGGKLAYVAVKSGVYGKTVGVLDGVEFGTDYDVVSGIMNVDGKLVYIALNDSIPAGHTFNYVIFDGVSRIYEGNYGTTSSAGNFGSLTGKLFVIGNKVAHITTKDNKWVVILDSASGRENNSQLLGSFANSNRGSLYGDVVNVNGQFVYISATESSKCDGYERRVIINGAESKQYCSVRELINIDGKIAYRAFDKEKGSIIVFDGNEFPIGFAAKSGPEPMNVLGKLLYFTQNGAKEFIVFNGKEIGQEYDKVDSPIAVRGKLAFRAMKDGKWILVYDGVESADLGDLYNGDFISVGDKIAYVGLKNGKKYIFMET